MLTGGDGDGSLGVRAVRAAGGTVIAQDPRTAEAPWMPASAVETGGVDVVLGLAEIGPALAALVEGWRGDACPRR